MGEKTYPLDEYPMWINMEPANEEIIGYPEAEIDRKVLLSIAGYADSQGIAWPTQRCVAHQTEYSATTVCASTKRLQDKRYLKVIDKKKMRKTDRHPRNIYAIASDMVRKEPDMRSCHFDAGKWKTIAARLKKHVSDAVDDMKQVAAGFAQSMANAKTSAKKRQRKQWRNGSYQRSYGSYSEPAISPEERQRQDWVNQLCQKAGSDLANANVDEGHWLACRYMRERLTKTPEQYDTILQDAIAKFKDYQDTISFEGRVKHGLNPLTGERVSDAVSDVRCVSPGDEPLSLKAAFGAALA